MKQRILEILSQSGPSRITPLKNKLGGDAYFKAVRDALKELEEVNQVTSNLNGLWEATAPATGPETGNKEIRRVRLTQIGSHLAAHFKHARELDEALLTFIGAGFSASVVARWNGSELVLPGVPYQLFSGQTVEVRGSNFKQTWDIEHAECIDTPWCSPELTSTGSAPPEQTFEKIDWETSLDDEQARVVHHPSDDCLIVDAPPGCGKTHTACARAAWLADKVGWGDGANQVLIISFTRIAVREMRERITRFVGGPSNFQIWTIDQLAYRIGQHTEGTFEDGIRAAEDWLSGEGRHVVRQFEHVIVDEAQDIVGAREGFVAQLLQTVNSNGGGFTVFHDPAQAIYDWSENDQEEEAHVRRLVEILDEEIDDEKLTHMSLQQLHRTDVTTLTSIFERSRTLALRENASQILALITEELPRVESDEIAKEVCKDDASTFLLARSRAEAMQWSSRLREQGVKHRLRFGGLPETVPGWLAIVANSVGKRRISWSEFEAAWTSMIFPQHFDDWEVEDAWLALDPYKQNKALDCHKVSKVISRHKPPAILARHPVGRGEVTVGTIHGVKGREASRVIISAKRRGKHEPAQPGDESRVWFVGLTRASQQLSSTRGWRFWSRTTQNGRPWRTTRKGRKQALFGLSGDISSLKGLGVVAGEPNSQCGIAALRFGAPVGCTRKEDGYELAVSGLPVGIFTKQVADDLYKIKSTVNRKTYGLPTEIQHLYCVDVATVSVPPKSAQMLDLKVPFAETRLWLQPVIVGFTVIYF